MAHSSSTSSSEPGGPRERATWPRVAAFWLALCLAVVAGDRVLAGVLGRLVLHANTRFSRLYSGRLPAGVLFFGNSRAVNAFYTPDLTKRLGRPTVNLGYNGLTMRIVEAILLDTLDRAPRPSLVVIEVSALTDDDAAVGELRMYTPLSDRLAAIDARTFPREARVVRWANLYAFDSEVFLRTLYFFRATDQTWINRYQVTTALLRSVESMPRADLGVSTAGLEALGRIAAHLDERGIPVRFMLAPYLPPYLEKLGNMDAWRGAVQARLGPRHRLRDYSGAVQDLHGFADRIHLNAGGSRLLSERFEKDGFFALERGAAEEPAVVPPP